MKKAIIMMIVVFAFSCLAVQRCVMALVWHHWRWSPRILLFIRFMVELFFFQVL